MEIKELVERNDSRALMEPKVMGRYCYMPDWGTILHRGGATINIRVWFDSTEDDVLDYATLRNVIEYTQPQQEGEDAEYIHYSSYATLASISDAMFRHTKDFTWWVSEGIDPFKTVGWEGN